MNKQDMDNGCPPRETMNGKPVLYRGNTRTVITDPSLAFGEKLLCDSLVMNLGDACAYSCTYCYCKGQVWKIDKPIVDEFNAHQSELNPSHTALDYQDVVIRRSRALAVLAEQLLRPDGSRRYSDPDDHRVIYSSTLVDVAANMELLRETAQACNLIFDHTGWQIRLLSKSNLLPKLVEMVPEKHHHRLIFGFSTGTFDEAICRAIEPQTARIGQRLKALHWLQDRGFRTFGMICPSLPQRDYDQFSRQASAAIRAERCEHVWAEVLNVRGQSFTATCEALKSAGRLQEEEMLRSVQGPGTSAAWEQYARDTFLAHSRTIPGDRLRFLQYITEESAGWWAPMRPKGALLLGKVAELRGLSVKGESSAVWRGPAESV